jgi:hypothetical protein
MELGVAVFMSIQSSEKNETKQNSLSQNQKITFPCKFCVVKYLRVYWLSSGVCTYRSY